MNKIELSPQQRTHLNRLKRLISEKQQEKNKLAAMGTLDAIYKFVEAEGKESIEISFDGFNLFVQTTEGKHIIFSVPRAAQELYIHYDDSGNMIFTDCSLVGCAALGGALENGLLARVERAVFNK